MRRIQKWLRNVVNYWEFKMKIEAVLKYFKNNKNNFEYAAGWYYGDAYEEGYNDGLAEYKELDDTSEYGLKDTKTVDQLSDQDYYNSGYVAGRSKMVAITANDYYLVGYKDGKNHKPKKKFD